MASKKSGPKIGLTAEEWVKHWETDFAEVTHRHGHHSHHHDHGHEGHHHHHHHGGSDEDRGCGSQKFIKKYLPKLVRDQASIKVLVSLCGDSTDVPFLAGKGHDVTGIEISEKAVKSIFEDPHRPTPYVVSEKPPFKVYTATNDKKISVYVGNFFDPLPSDMGPFDAIWDGHGIISLPEKDMQPYADKLKQLLKTDGAILFSTVWFDVSELTKGTLPAPISTTELQKFFPGYKVELLENEIVEKPNFEGVTKVTNPVNLVTKVQ